MTGQHPDHVGYVCVCVFFRLMMLMHSDFHVSIGRTSPKLNCKSPEMKPSLECLQGNENETGNESSPQTETEEGKRKPDRWLSVFNLKKGRTHMSFELQWCEQACSILALGSAWSDTKTLGIFFFLLWVHLLVILYVHVPDYTFILLLIYHFQCST